MRKLLVSQFISLDGVIQAPGGKTEDTSGGFTRGGWTLPFWCDEMGATFGTLFADAGAVLLGRNTYVSHAGAFEPNEAEDPFAGTQKVVVSKTLERSLWRDTTILRDADVVGAIRALKAAPAPGPKSTIVSDGSWQLMQLLFANDLVDELHLFLYPLVLGHGKKLFPDGASPEFALKSATPFPSGVVSLHYTRAR